MPVKTAYSLSRLSMTIPAKLKTTKNVIMLLVLCTLIGFFVGKAYGADKATKEMEELLYSQNEGNY